MRIHIEFKDGSQKDISGVRVFYPTGTLDTYMAVMSEGISRYDNVTSFQITDMRDLLDETEEEPSITGRSFKDWLNRQ